MLAYKKLCSNHFQIVTIQMQAPVTSPLPSTYIKEVRNLVHVPNFGGLSGSEDRGGGDNSIQFINFERVGDKSFEEWRQKIGVGDNNILTFSSYCTR